MTKITRDIDIAVSELRKGNIVALPTETVYGLGANALDSAAVLKIFEAKKRPEFNPLIVHVGSIGDFEKYAIEIPDTAYRLAERFSPGPITFILKKKKVIPDIVTAGNDTVGLRVPSHPIMREVLAKSSLPVAAPSANMSGRISPTDPEEVLSELEDKVDYILDGGKCSVGIESTVVDLSGEKIQILRHGYVTKEEIEQTAGKVSEAVNGKIISPGMLKSHYAPATKMYIASGGGIDAAESIGNAGVLDLRKYESLKDAALNMYSDLRSIDRKNFDCIICYEVESKGIGAAINDRLRRASSGKAELSDGKFKLIES